MYNDILISIGMPTYGQHRYILAAINSILTQSQKNIELIIVPVYGDKKTIKRLNGLKDNRIKIIFSNYAMITHQKNLAMFASSGKYFMFFASDDILYPRALENLLKFSEKYKTIISFPDFCFSDIKKLKQEHIVVPNNNIVDVSFTLREEFIKYFPLKFSDKKYRLSKVWELMLAKPEYKGRIKHYPGETFMYIQHGQNIHLKGSQKNFSYCTMGENKDLEEFQKNIPLVDKPHHLTKNQYCIYLVDPLSFLKNKKNSFKYKRIIIHWDNSILHFVDLFKEHNHLYHISHKYDVIDKMKSVKLKNIKFIKNRQDLLLYLEEHDYEQG